MGYFILPEYHNQGYVTEAVNEIVRFAFKNDGVYRISTGCITENRSPGRVMQKCGLIKEAERKSYAYPDDDILLPMDDASWHKTKGLLIPSNIELFFLPPYMQAYYCQSLGYNIMLIGDSCYTMLYPPSTTKSEPVANWEASLAKYTYAPIKSSG